MAATAAAAFRRAAGLFSSCRAVLPRARLSSAQVTWGDAVPLRSHLAASGRGMELSTLTWFGGRLLSCDDRTGATAASPPPQPPRDTRSGVVTSRAVSLGGVTSRAVWAGIVYEISKGEARPRHILAGPTAAAHFKCEWAAVRHGQLYVGGIGRRLDLAPRAPSSSAPRAPSSAPRAPSSAQPRDQSPHDAGRFTRPAARRPVTTSSPPSTRPASSRSATSPPCTMSSAAPPAAAASAMRRTRRPRGW